MAWSSSKTWWQRLVPWLALAAALQIVIVMRRGEGGTVGQHDGACHVGVDEAWACHQDGGFSCGWFTGRYDWISITY
jgi:hypothetical protein